MGFGFLTIDGCFEFPQWKILQQHIQEAKFQWYALEERYHIKRYHACVGYYVGTLHALQKLSEVGNAVSRSSYEWPEVAKHSFR